MSNTLKDKQGNLTAYAYACGYVDTHTWQHIDNRLTLGFENGCYYIKGYRPYNIADKDLDLSNKSSIWRGKHVSENIKTLKNARKRFNELCRMPDIAIG